MLKRPGHRVASLSPAPKRSSRPQVLQLFDFRRARVAELADAPDLGSGGLNRGGSSPPFRTNQFIPYKPALLFRQMFSQTLTRSLRPLSVGRKKLAVGVARVIERIEPRASNRCF